MGERLQLGEIINGLERAALQLDLILRALKTEREYNARHLVGKWSGIADALAALNEGDYIFIRSDDPKVFAQRLRNGLNGHKSVIRIHRKVEAQNGGVIVRHDGYWD